MSQVSCGKKQIAQLIGPGTFLDFGRETRKSHGYRHRKAVQSQPPILTRLCIKDVV